MSIMGYARPDGGVGIRNHITVIYTVDAARLIATKMAKGESNAHVFGIGASHANHRAYKTLLRLATHVNVAGAIVVSVGTEHTDYKKLVEEIKQTGRPAEGIVISELGGSGRAIEAGIDAIASIREHLRDVERVTLASEDLVVGVECGGSDATSGITANPACGHAIDLHLDRGGTALFLEIYELLGCEPYLLDRAVNNRVRERLTRAIERARRASVSVGDFGVSPGNQEGGLTTIEEKSLGALLKGGTRPIRGVLDPLESPPGKGLYMIDYSQGDGERMLSYYEDSDPEGVNAMIASGAHLVLFTTGRGSVTGSVVGPVIKICGNPVMAERMSENFDINAGKVITGESSIEEVGEEIYQRIIATAQGSPSAAEALGHHEYWIPPKR